MSTVLAVIAALDTMAWPGAFGLGVVCATVVGTLLILMRE